MANKIMNESIVKRSSPYCYYVEVSDTAMLEGVANSVYEEYREEYGLQEVLFFLEILTVYYLPCKDGEESPEDEKQVYEFSFRDYVLEHLEG